MSNKNFNVYFDFGSSKIRAAAFDKVNLNNNFHSENSCISVFTINNSDYKDSEDVIEKIILDLEKKTNQYLNTVNLMIDSPEIFSISLSLSKNFDGTKLKKEDIQFLIQDAKQQILTNYPKQNILHIIVNNYKIDNIDYDFLPIEIDCNLISLDIFFICLPKRIIENIKKIFVKFNVLIDQIFCSSYAKSLHYRGNFNLNEDITFIDMGYNKTSIISYNKNNFSFFEMIPIGGNHITKDLSKILNIDLSLAEKIKLYFAKDEYILTKENFSSDLIQKIIFSRIEEILELSTQSIKFNENFKRNKKFKLVLMGEGSKILDNKFKEKISFPYEIDLLDETNLEICEAVLKLSEGINKQEVLVIPKKQIKKGFFEKFFHFFS